MSTVNGFQVGSETLKYNYESLDNYNTPNFSTSSSTTYAVGDYVMYNGKLYKCTTATTGGTWVSDDWNEAVLSEDVRDLTRQISDTKSAIGVLVNKLSPSDFERGVWTSNTKAGSDIRIRTKDRIPVTKGDFIEIVPNGLYFSIAIYASAESTTPLQVNGWVGGNEKIMIPVYFTGVMVLMAANAQSYNESTVIVPNDFVSVFTIWWKDVVENNLVVKTLNLETTDFVKGLFNSNNGQSIASIWYRTPFNLDVLANGVTRMRIVPASGMRVVVVVFSQRPNYTDWAINSEIFLNSYSGTADQVLDVEVNPEYYYVIETNIETLAVENLPAIDVVISKNLAIEQTIVSRYKGKKLSIMGDSISSYNGVSPSGTGYASFYPKDDVQTYKLMWWWVLANKLQMDVLKINANSGSTVSTANTSVVECSSNERTSAMGLNESNPDVIICECGLNDFYYDVELGNYDGITQIGTDRSKFKNAYAYMLNKLQTNYPNAEILCCTLTQNVHSGYRTLDSGLETVVNSGGQRLIDYNKAIKEIAGMFGCKIIDMEKCGFTLRNLEEYTMDDSPNCFHPNSVGHNMMATQAIKNMK